ncbi:phosphatase PAP2 family protein [Lachnoclostridium phytofermentans]|uniref:Phosphatase n=1 Tax=Lachnoclostridium phytofermentans (strain ATCC 700394 / DSM 18823 / ISDg) TaxID=357809 RepID=A9KK76_LACP7|nr:phosphatase PAP2 family protein [Lachnoclostridium phytofermentans]ABX44067.1 phosphatase [Lachnoclostridium phytofermentans ISDg]
MNTFIKKYKHAWVLLYFFIYAPWFVYLEKTITTNYHSVHIKLDDYIPFNELFVIPYYLWFVLIALVVGYLFFKDKKEYYRSTAFLFIGMTVCLFIYTIWPNGQDLRPDLATLGRDNILIDIVRNLYRTDTNTNVCPSIHAFNSIGICIAVFHTNSLKDKRYITIPTVILAILICMSTVFLKQHSVFDVISASLLSIVMYLVVYVPDYAKVFEKKKESVKSTIS